MKAAISHEGRPDILRLAINRNRDNVNVWAEILKYHVVNFDGYRTVKKLFDVGNRVLRNKSLPLWEIMDSFLQQYCDIKLV